MIASIGLVAGFILPGLVIRAAYSRQHLGFLYIFSLAYGFWLLNLVIARWWGMSTDAFSLLITFEGFGLLSIVTFLSFKSFGQDRQNDISLGIQTCLLRSWCTIIQFWGLLIAWVLTVTYLNFVGPYTEMPADVWEHLGRIQDEYQYILKTDVIRGGEIYANKIHELLNESGRYWYLLVAIACYVAKIDPYSFLHELNLSISLLFISGLYFFNRAAISGLTSNGVAREVVNLLALCLFVLTFGKDVFSFFRYYTFAPVFLNFIVFLSGTLLLVRALAHGDRSREVIFQLILVFLVTHLVHRQETSFLLVFWVLASAVVLIQKATKYPGKWGGPGRNEKRSSSVSNPLAAIILVAVFGITIYINVVFGFRALHPSLVTQIWSAPQLFILNLEAQLLPTMGIFGLTVIALYWAYFKNYKKSLLFLVTGLILPLTMLNPVFVTTFLKVNDSYTVWRFLYMQMTPLVGALLIFQAVQHLALTGNANRWKRVRGGIVLLAICVPVVLGVVGIDQSVGASRWSTLTKVSEGNDERYLSDLASFLANYKGVKQVITDPVTGYILKGMTGAQIFTRKYQWDPEHSLDRARYGVVSFDEHEGWLLVVNLRLGDPSLNGSLSGHWDEGVLDTREYYSKGFLNWVERTEKASLADNLEEGYTYLTKLWQKDGIIAYKIGVQRT
jgi:hypothetical protein